MIFLVTVINLNVSISGTIEVYVPSRISTSDKFQ